MTKRCEKCEMDAMLDRGIGFTPPAELPPSKDLLLQRLRTWSLGDIGKEAADEIERLQRELEQAKADYGHELAKQLAHEPPADERERFEGFLHGYSYTLQRDSDGDYTELPVELAFEAWLARAHVSSSQPPEVIPDATRKLGELAAAHIVLRTALSQITVQRLRGRKTSAGQIAESALEKTASAGHLAVALGTAPLSGDLERYQQALYRANGFLIQQGLEPVKLEYSTATKESAPHV